MSEDTTFFVRTDGKPQTLEWLLKKKKIKFLVRSTKDGHALFRMYTHYNPRWKSGAGWTLREPAHVLKVIEAAKKRPSLQLIKEK